MRPDITDGLRQLITSLEQKCARKRWLEGMKKRDAAHERELLGLCEEIPELNSQITAIQMQMPEAET